jgi:hypothetical protein
MWDVYFRAERTSLRRDRWDICKSSMQGIGGIAKVELIRGIYVEEKRRNP